MAQAQFLNSPLEKKKRMKRRTKECESTQLLVVWTEEREKKERRGEKKSLVCHKLSVSFFSLLD